jgi:hypothetical protein
MIKEGDKVVCVREHIFYRGGGTDAPLTHKQGKCYEVFKYDPSDETVYINAEEQYAGLWFNLNHRNNGDISCLRNYFITLAEWRDKQIESILDESTDGK